MTTSPFEENGVARYNHMTLNDDGQVVFFVTTMRPGETVRVFSLRRASVAECELFSMLVRVLGYVVSGPRVNEARSD